MNEHYLNDEKVRIAMPDELQTMLELANTDAGKTFLSAVGADAFVGNSLLDIFCSTKLIKLLQ